MVKPLHAGMAARNAVMAARLAQRGFTASPSAIDGAQGYLAAMDSEHAGLVVMDVPTTRQSPVPSSFASDCAMRAAGSPAPASITPHVSMNAIDARCRASSDMAVSTMKPLMTSMPSMNAMLMSIAPNTSPSAPVKC
jgi:hypothetical protein